MKKTSLVSISIIVSLVILLPFALNIQTANAQQSYTIQRVDHNIKVLYSGHIIVTDKVQISGQPPATFLMGFPFQYGAHLLKGIAYDTNGNFLPVAIGVELQGQSGFYGVSIDLSASSPQVFTAVFTFSNTLQTPTNNGFNFGFPAYPSFTQPTQECNVAITLPTTDTTLIGIDKPDGIVNASTYSKTNLETFTYAPATATFSQQTAMVQLVDVNSLNSIVFYSPEGEVTRTDTYRITNVQNVAIYYFRLNVPPEATNVLVRDQFGRDLQVDLLHPNTDALDANSTFQISLGQNQSTELSVSYSLPQVPPLESGQFMVSQNLFAMTNYYIEEASVTFSPPEGARFVAPTISTAIGSHELLRSAFQETLTIKKQGISSANQAILQENQIQFTYEYNSLWIAFRPTSWAWAIVAVGLVIVALWRRPKTKAKAPRITSAKAVAGLALSGENIREFTEATEEKNNLTRELRALEARVAHGRIPRRRYKVQRKTIEIRLSNLSHTIAQLKEILRNAGGTYADTVKQLETAEIELNQVEINLKNIEVRHETGEMPLEIYRKQVAELEQRRERAEAAVDGLLLRLRGEIR